MRTVSPPISVVVCTRDRPDLLRECLASLAHVDYPSFEVVIVDNASRGPGTAQVVAGTPWRCVREERPGLDWARNRGAQEARHELLAYLDDDATAEAGWLRALADAMADPEVAAVTGLVLPAELLSDAQRLFERYVGMGKGATPRRFSRETMSTRERLAVQSIGVGTNMAFRRSVLAALGGFDTALDVGTPSAGGGDLDLFHRLIEAGYVLRYEPLAVVRHRHRREMDALRKQLRENGRAYGVYLIKVLRAGSVGRAATLQFAARWAGGWLLTRLLRGLLGRERFPIRLIWAEIAGALSAPLAYVATYRSDRQLRAAIGAGTHAVRSAPSEGTWPAA